MKQALKALIHEMEYVLSCINADKVPFDGDDFHEALRLGKEALAQPEHEPVAWMLNGFPYKEKQVQVGGSCRGQEFPNQTPLYTTQPQRKPLTPSEINQIEARWDASMHGSKIAFVVRETEAAHGIKE